MRGLLPVDYFHVVFTVPACLQPLFVKDRRQSYALLFAAVRETLGEVCRRRLGANPGVIAVLHTWSQTLVFHPHVHCIVTGGGIDSSGERWIRSRPDFLVPVRVLSRVFRGKLLQAFERSIGSPHSAFGKAILRQAAAQPWVVYSKPPMAGPQQVLRYLGRYTHRIAIGNERIVSISEGHVSFRYRDRRRGKQGLPPHRHRLGVRMAFPTACLAQALRPPAPLWALRQRSAQRQARRCPSQTRSASHRSTPPRSCRVLAAALSPHHRARAGSLSGLRERNPQDRGRARSHSTSDLQPRAVV